MATPRGQGDLVSRGGVDEIWGCGGARTLIRGDPGCGEKSHQRTSPKEHVREKGVEANIDTTDSQ